MSGFVLTVGFLIFLVLFELKIWLHRRASARRWQDDDGTSRYSGGNWEMSGGSDSWVDFFCDFGGDGGGCGDGGGGD